MLLLIMLLIILAILAKWFFERKKAYIAFTLMNCGFLGMLFVCLVYFVKIGGILPNHANLLFGHDTLLNYIKNLPFELNNMALFANIFRFSTAYMFFVNSIGTNLFFKNLFCKYKVLYIIALLPALTMIILTSPSVMFNTFAYMHFLQSILINLSYILLLAYIIFGFYIFFSEYRLIALSWYKKRHISNMIGMALFVLPYLLFAQFDPILIYQDYNRVSVFTRPILFVSSNHIAVWFTAFAVCILSCTFMVYQNFKYFKFDYDSSKLEMHIKSRVTAAELSTSMILHGLKNQLLSAKIINNKIENKLKNEDINKEELQILAEKLSEINSDMSDKLSYLYKTMTDVQTTLIQCSSADLFEIVIKKTAKKDVNNIVTFEIANGSLLIDKELLAEAIYNIISNAIDAVAQKQYQKVIVRMFFTRNHAVISITDNGTGMENNIKRKIFIPFTSSKNSNTNWGLGLCYARRIVKKHMGDIRFESVLKKGTTFYISLPRYLRNGQYE